MFTDVPTPINNLIISFSGNASSSDWFTNDFNDTHADYTTSTSFSGSQSFTRIPVLRSDLDPTDGYYFALRCDAFSPCRMFLDLFYPSTPDPYQVIGSATGSGSVTNPETGDIVPVSGSSVIDFNGGSVFATIDSVRGMPGRVYSPVMRDSTGGYLTYYVGYAIPSIIYLPGYEDQIFNSGGPFFDYGFTFPHKFESDFIDPVSGVTVPFAPAVDYTAQRIQSGNPRTGQPEIQRITMQQDYFPKSPYYSSWYQVNDSDGFPINMGAAFMDIPMGDDALEFAYNYTHVSGHSCPWWPTLGLGITSLPQTFSRISSGEEWDGMDGFNAFFGFSVAGSIAPQLSASLSWRNLIYNGLACCAHRLRGNLYSNFGTPVVPPLDFLDCEIEGMVYKGDLFADTSPTFEEYPAASRGDVYYVGGPGLLADRYFRDNDYLICTSDTPAGGIEVEDNWTVARPIEDIVKVYAESPSSILVVITPTTRLWNRLGGTVPLIRGKCGLFRLEEIATDYSSGLGYASLGIRGATSINMDNGDDVTLGAVTGMPDGFPYSVDPIFGEFNADEFTPSFTVSNSGGEDQGGGLGHYISHFDFTMSVAFS